MIVIRNETEKDYKTVEEITRKAFYNIYVPGCMEHYLVHIMRDHEDFIKELRENTLDGRKWMYYDSPVMQVDEKEAKDYDDSLEKMEKKVLPCQEEFYILSHSCLSV